MKTYGTATGIVPPPTKGLATAITPPRFNLNDESSFPMLPSFVNVVVGGVVKTYDDISKEYNDCFNEHFYLEEFQEKTPSELESGKKKNKM